MKISDETLIGNSPRVTPLVFDDLAVHSPVSVALSAHSLEHVVGQSGHISCHNPRSRDLAQPVQGCDGLSAPGDRRRSGYAPWPSGAAGDTRRRWYVWLNVLRAPICPHISNDGDFDVSARKVSLLTRKLINSIFY